MRKVKLVYCDYISQLVKESLVHGDLHNLISDVSAIQLDLGDHGELRSTTKTIHVQDVLGKRYEIVIMESLDD